MKNLLLYLLLLTSFNLSAQAPSYVPTDSLVGWWPFNGNANDLSGTGNDGTVTGAMLTTDRFGAFDSAYSFDGNGDYIDCGNDMSVNISSSISFSAWILANNFNTDHGIVSKMNGGVATYDLITSADFSSPPLDNLRWNAAGPVLFSTAINANQWMHIVAVFNSVLQTKSIYLNGNIFASHSVAISVIPTNSDNLFIGSHQPSIVSTWSWDGKLDDIGIWNRALDSCEVKDLYFASLGNCCTANPITDQPTDQTVNISNNASIDFSDSLTAATYQWQMDAGTGYSDLSNAGQFSGADTDSLIISTTTMGNNNTNYRCIVTESASCMDTTDVVLLTVINDVSIGELNNSLVTLFPNPSNDIITLTLAQHSNGQIILTDILGKELLSKSFTSNEVQISLKNLASKGTYFAKIIDVDGNVIAIKKLIYQ